MMRKKPKIKKGSLILLKKKHPYYNVLTNCILKVHKNSIKYRYAESHLSLDKAIEILKLKWERCPDELSIEVPKCIDFFYNQEGIAWEQIPDGNLTIAIYGDTNE